MWAAMNQIQFNSRKTRKLINPGPFIQFAHTHTPLSCYELGLYIRLAHWTLKSNSAAPNATI